MSQILSHKEKFILRNLFYKTQLLLRKDVHSVKKITDESENLYIAKVFIHSTFVFLNNVSGLKYSYDEIIGDKSIRSKIEIIFNEEKYDLAQDLFFRKILGKYPAKFKDQYYKTILQEYLSYGRFCLYLKIKPLPCKDKIFSNPSLHQRLLLLENYLTDRISLKQDKPKEDIRVKWAIVDLSEEDYSSAVSVISGALNIQKNIICHRYFISPKIYNEGSFKYGLYTPDEQFFGHADNPRKVDVLGISLVNPVQLPSLIKAFDILHIPVLRVDREKATDKFPIVVMGGSFSANLESSGAIPDIVILGHGERAACEISKVLIKKQDRKAGLLEIAKNIKEAYVPMYSIEKPASQVEIASLDWQENKDILFAAAPFARGGEFTLITSRGCKYKCSFCQYSHMEKKKINTPFCFVTEAIAKLKNHKAKTVRIAAASPSDYFDKDLKKGYSDIIKQFLDEGIFPIISSDRAELLDSFILSKIRSKSGNILLAPESSPNIRTKVLHKTLTEDKLEDCLKKITELEFTKIMLYTMVGLPMEKEIDLIYIAVDLPNKINKIYDSYAKKKPRIDIYVSPLIPSPFTPLYTLGFPKWEYFEDVIKFMREMLQKSDIKNVTIIPSMSLKEYSLEKSLMKADEIQTEEVIRNLMAVQDNGKR